MRIGIRDGCLGLSAMESFAVAVELGFDGIEVCIGGDYATSLLWQDGDEWKPVEADESYGVDKDKLNRVTFQPVTTTALRLEVQLQDNASGGILEWRLPK